MLSDVSLISSDTMRAASRDSEALIKAGHLVQLAPSEGIVCHNQLCVDGQRVFGCLVKNSAALEE